MKLYKVSNNNNASDDNYARVRTINNIDHRNYDLPVWFYFDGFRTWWIDGELHRSNNKPAVIWEDGRKEHWKNGERYFII